MPPRNGHPAIRTEEPAPVNRMCPKCSSETEPIEVAAEGLPFEELQLCPACYLVTWRDEAGFHVRQGLPVKLGSGYALEPEGSFYDQPKRPHSC
jgi:hypothetical protein